MKRLLLLATCLLISGATANAQDSYIQKAYKYFFGSCPSFSGTAFDIHKKSGDGLNATYYNGSSFDHEILRRTDPEIYFYYSGTSPAFEVNVYQFSVVWSGYLYAPVSGEYMITFKADDGVRLWLNGKTLINEWHGKEASEYTERAKLTGGEAYEIRIEYYQANKEARAELYWEYPGQNKRVVPQKYLFTNLEEPQEPLVLLGPSFMTVDTQKKFAQPETPTPPSRPDYDNALASTNQTNSNAKKTQPTVVAINNPTPNRQKDVESPVVAQVNPSVTNTRITQRNNNSINANTNVGENTLTTPSAQTSTIDSENSDQIISESLSMQSNVNIESHNPSLLKMAIGKTKPKTKVSLRPRRSGPIILKNILFDKDRYRLKPSSYDELNALVDTLKKNLSLSVLIAGHTDFAGDPIPNQNLSESRARAVAVYLIRHGINSMRIQTKGYGGTKPLSRAPLGTEDRRKNKRVEYILIEEGAKP